MNCERTPLNELLITAFIFAFVRPNAAMDAFYLDQLKLPSFRKGRAHTMASQITPPCKPFAAGAAYLILDLRRRDYKLVAMVLFLLSVMYRVRRHMAWVRVARWVHIVSVDWYLHPVVCVHCKRISRVHGVVAWSAWI